MSDTILLVEDEDSDVEIFMMAAKEVRFSNPIQVVKDGQQAMDYFSGIGKYSNRERFPLPALVLLDLKLPYRMGMVVLHWLRTQPKFKSTIVIVFTSSESKSDISKAYEEGANAYLVKPPTLDGLGYLIRNLKNFWLNADLRRPEKIGEHLKTLSIFESLPLTGKLPGFVKQLSNK
ncbi:MAG TPA: response regulator [Candidatus Baltobacteraceae bacterium]|nr:response regulator [Candidatus Baltobacteraceae bacterium]